MTDKVSVDLSGPAQTMLTTLYCKALDADWDRPILGDGFAKEAVARIDYDWDELKVTDRWTPLVTVRTAQFDIWAAQFLAVNPRCHRDPPGLRSGQPGVPAGSRARVWNGTTSTIRP